MGLVALPAANRLLVSVDRLELLVQLLGGHGVLVVGAREDDVVLGAAQQLLVEPEEDLRLLGGAPAVGVDVLKKWRKK